MHDHRVSVPFIILKEMCMLNTQVLATAKLPNTKIRKLKIDLLFLEVGKFVKVEQHPSTVKNVFDVEIMANGALDSAVTKNLFDSSLTSGMLYRQKWGDALTLVES